MTYQLIHGDARHVSDLLEPESVDLIVTSPPYFALRSYQDGGEHYDGQIGSEPTPTEFVDALVACTADWLRVLRPGGSIFVNLGDKYAGSDGTSGATTVFNTKRTGAAAPRRQPIRRRSDGIPAKSLMGLPWRYALRCVDELGLILRAEIVWSKPNGLPESVTDRVRRSHEQWFHFTREGRYFAAIDEVREPSDPANAAHAARYGGLYPDACRPGASAGENNFVPNPLGKVPGSVWTIPSEPLVVPDELGVDHFAAFPSEWPRRIILGWSPSGYCTACDEPRRAVVDKEVHGLAQGRIATVRDASRGDALGSPTLDLVTSRTIIGYVCACRCNCRPCAGGIRGLQAGMGLGECQTKPAPARPAVVLDPFAGTGTTVAVAHLLGRHGIGTDLSHDYLRLAEWRCSSDTRLRDKVLDRTGIPNPEPPKIDGQMDLFGETV